MPTTWIAFSAERQRDGPREASVPVLTRIFTEHLGSFGTGLLSILLFGRNYAGITLSIVGATIVMYFVRRSRGGGLLDPGRPSEPR
jgi:hypothetical protein